jgi:tRNA A-37 threonylcarbamoyl transferase component Bud32
MADFNFSIFSPALATSTGGSVLIEVLDRVLRGMGEEDRWEVALSGPWCYATPTEQLRRPQGWKLHISATPASAEMVLVRSLPVLLQSCSAFKFASTIDHVGLLNARNTSRGHSGKFITIYPQSDEEAVRLAHALHQATAGLAGPRILSDRPYEPGSLVHYRYGAFVEERKISNDGFYAWVIFDPEGNPVEDRRVGQYVPPAWAPCPFPNVIGNSTSDTNSGGQGVLLGDRFLVREAIRHLNKGGVYRAVDTQSGADVVIKEARPHVAADETGKDVRDRLRAEARALEKVWPLGVAPRPVMLFEQSQHLFLAEELIPGVPLRQWVPDRIREGGWRRHVPTGLEMAGRLVALMDVIHQASLILRDFNPNNIMVLPDGQLRLIDLELAVMAGEQEEKLIRAGTPGYSAPEQLQGSSPAVEADYFSLGATICFVVTGDAPYFLEDVPETRPLRERLAEWLTVRGEALDIPPHIQRLILGLMDDEPTHRWTTSEARNALATARTSLGRSRRAHSSSAHGFEHNNGRLGDEQWQQAVDGIVGYLLTSMNPTDGERLWPVSCAHGAPDPCCLQHGAAGVLGVLTRCFELTSDQRLPEVMATAGKWITQRLQAGANRPAGLYFGEAGIAWSLYEAGRVLGDDKLTEQGLTLVETLPLSSLNPDITHGTAGIGLTFLHFWLRTGNKDFVERASKGADTLIASASEEPAGVIWGTPAEFESRLAGKRYHGFAHGTAGVGYFLLGSALATGRSDCLALACRAGETLLANAIVEGGLALWSAGSGDDTTAPYWCHGSAGIGTFLTRLHRATGDDRFGKLAHMSAQAVMENTWRGVLGQCHGLAGNGEFLLDVAEAAGDQRYESMAHQLARVIFASRAYREGHVVFPNEQGGLSATWGDGMSGILSFLLRLRYRSSRLWMADLPLERSHQA